MPDDTGFEDKCETYCIRKMLNIAIRTSYYIFCCRNKEWSEMPNYKASNLMFFVIVCMLFACKYILLFILVTRVMIQVPGCKLP